MLYYHNSSEIMKFIFFILVFFVPEKSEEVNQKVVCIRTLHPPILTPVNKSRFTIFSSLISDTWGLSKTTRTTFETRAIYKKYYVFYATRLRVYLDSEDHPARERCLSFHIQRNLKKQKRFFLTFLVLKIAYTWEKWTLLLCRMPYFCFLSFN